MRTARQIAGKAPPGPATAPGVLTATVPLRTRSAANLREHWAVRAKRVKTERDAGVWATKAMGNTPQVWALLEQPLAIHLVRILGPRGRLLDDDNLRSSLKAFRDGVAEALGINDGDQSAAVWSYAEEAGLKWAVRIEIRSAPGAWAEIQGATK